MIPTTTMPLTLPNNCLKSFGCSRNYFLRSLVPFLFYITGPFIGQLLNLNYLPLVHVSTSGQIISDRSLRVNTMPGNCETILCARDYGQELQ